MKVTQNVNFKDQLQDQKQYLIMTIAIKLRPPNPISIVQLGNIQMPSVNVKPRAFTSGSEVKNNYWNEIVSSEK